MFDLLLPVSEHHSTVPARSQSETVTSALVYIPLHSVLCPDKIKSLATLASQQFLWMLILYFVLLLSMSQQIISNRICTCCPLALRQQDSCTHTESSEICKVTTSCRILQQVTVLIFQWREIRQANRHLYWSIYPRGPGYNNNDVSSCSCCVAVAWCPCGPWSIWH
jgi:hypothetical protein